MSRASDADPLAVVDPRRHVELERDVLEDPAVALAPLTRRLDDAARAVAARAGARPDDLPEHRARDLLHDARAAAARAGDRRRPRGRARAVARRATPGDADDDVERDPARGIGEVDLHLRRDVGAPRRPRPSPLRLAEERLAEERGEHVREAAEVRVHRREAAADSRMAEPVVRAAPLRVREHLVRLRDGAEPPVGVRLVADVGVELARKTAERPLDLRVARVARDSEELVVVLLGRRHQVVP